MEGKDRARYFTVLNRAKDYMTKLLILKFKRGKSCWVSEQVFGLYTGGSISYSVISLSLPTKRNRLFQLPRRELSILPEGIYLTYSGVARGLGYFQ